MEANRWVKCPKCTHKLFWFEGLKRGQNIDLHIKIKCSSCKRIVKVFVVDGWVGAEEDNV